MMPFSSTTRQLRSSFAIIGVDFNGTGMAVADRNSHLGCRWLLLACRYFDKDSCETRWTQSFGGKKTNGLQMDNGRLQKFAVCIGEVGSFIDGFSPKVSAHFPPFP